MESYHKQLLYAFPILSNGQTNTDVKLFTSRELVFVENTLK